MSRPKFAIGISPRNQYYFTLIAENDERLLTSEHYTQRAHVIWGIGAVQRSAPINARYQKFGAKSGAYFFVLEDGNGEPLGKSGMYASPAALEGGIDTVKRVALTAQIVEQGARLPTRALQNHK
jgi:uncharacterized protein YegP (UPF0339 family)